MAAGGPRRPRGALRGRPAGRAGPALGSARRSRRWISRSGRSPRPTRALAVHLRRARRRAGRGAEFLIHRSAYQLKEADPHSWALPRLSGPPEGGPRGDPGRRVRRRQARADPRHDVRPRHGGAAASTRPRRLSRRDPRLHARHRQPDVAPGPPPALARRDRGPPRAVRDDLVDTEPPLRDAGCAGSASASEATAFFDEHVEADAVHENIAAVDLAGGLARQQPELGADVLWGARALAGSTARWPRPSCARWEAGESSLRAADARLRRAARRRPLAPARPSGARKRELVGAVAERPQSASGRSGRGRPSRARDDLGAVLVLQAHGPADDERAVAVGGDRDREGVAARGQVAS